MVSTDVTAFQLSPAEHQVQLRRAVIASTIGTTIEWYDFFLYSTVDRPRLREAVLPAIRSAGRNARGLRHLCCRLRRAAGRRGDLRPLRRSHRPQVDADRHAAADGHRHLPGGVRADLRADRHLGRGHPDDPALHPGRRRRRRVGRLGADVDGMGPRPHSTAASSPPGRSSACPSGLFLANLAVLAFSQMSGDQFLPGAGAFRSFSASSWSAVGLYIRLGILETPVFAKLVAENRRSSARRCSR